MDLQSGWNSSWCYPLQRSSSLNTFAPFSSDISSSIVGRVFRSLRTALFPNKKRTIVFLVGLPHINTWVNIISVLLRLCTIPMMWAHHQPSRWCLSLLDSLAPFPLISQKEWSPLWFLCYWIHNVDVHLTCFQFFYASKQIWELIFDSVN